MKRKITGGLTSVSLALFIQNTTSTTGGGLAGLTHSTAGLVAEYRRAGQSVWTTITLATKTLGTWTSGGFVADGSRAGYYELDLPNAAVAAGARVVWVRLYGAANMLDVPIEIELDAVDYQTARMGAAAAGDAMTLDSATLTALLDVQEKVDSIAVAFAGASPVESTGRIANGGRILAYVGDDFRVRSGTALPIPVSDPAGGLYTLLTSIGVENLQFGASLAGKPAGLITGTIASITQSGSGASQLCNITIEISDIGVGLKLSEDYEWQIQSTQTHDSESDTLIRVEGMLSLRRNVVG